MSRLTPAEPIAVRVGDCLCEGTPHADGDFVYLEPKLSLDGGLQAKAVMVAFGEDELRLEHELGLAYLLAGIADWNFLDDDGKPIPVNPDTIRRALPWGAGGRLVAEEANRLYFDQVILPLQEAARKLYELGATASSTSRRQSRKAGTRKPRSSSSSATSRRALTA